MNEVLIDAGRLYAPFVGDAGYALAYGSHASGNAGTNSDLDLLYVSPAPLDASQLARS